MMCGWVGVFWLLYSTLEPMMKAMMMIGKIIGNDEDNDFMIMTMKTATMTMVGCGDEDDDNYDNDD